MHNISWIAHHTTSHSSAYMIIYDYYRASPKADNEYLVRQKSTRTSIPYSLSGLPSANLSAPPRYPGWSAILHPRTIFIPQSVPVSSEKRRHFTTCLSQNSRKERPRFLASFINLSPRPNREICSTRDKKLAHFT